MKKLLLIIFVIFISGSVFSQKKSFTFGPLIGFNTSKLSTNIDDITEQMKAHFQFGLFVRIGQKIYVQPELVYTTKGGILKNPFEEEMTILMGQIEVPVLIGWRIVQFGIGNLRIMAGPVAGFVTNKSVSEVVNEPITVDDLSNIAWAAQFGAGIDLLFLSLDVRYEIGLNNLYTGGGDETLKNNLWHISLAFKLM